VIRLDHLTVAAEEGWQTLFDLAEVDDANWLLIGGQMMHLLAAEHGVSERVRPTDDVDIVMNVRAKPVAPNGSPGGSRTGASSWKVSAPTGSDTASYATLKEESARRSSTYLLLKVWARERSPTP
jgi:hypothetical protein